MLFLGAIIVSVNIMSLNADEFRKLNRLALNEIHVIVRKYRNEPRHSKKTVKPAKRERVNVKGVTVR
jgi:hypothetical protein